MSASASAAKEIRIKLPTMHPGQFSAYEEMTRLYAVRCGRRWGKALALDTPIPTPTGWTLMGSLEEGDMVFDEQGNSCSVIAVTDIMLDRPCNRVLFSDGSELIADDEHQWLTQTTASRKRPHLHKPQVKTTVEIASTIHHHGEANHSIPCTQPLKLFAKRLTIDPYVLGTWLGDGSSRSADFWCHPKDVQIIEEIREAGEPIKKAPNQDPLHWRLTDKAGAGGFHNGQSFQARLKALGLLGNKHIPHPYLRSSAAQRLALLQGLMDTDGHAQIGGRCEFCSIKKHLAYQVLELALSLGLRATMTNGLAKLNGKDCGPTYRVKFTTSKPVFRLKRKLDRVKSRKARFNMEQRMIVSVKRIPSVPVRCIMVDSPSHLYLAGRSFIPTHNTTFGSIIAEDAAIKGELVGYFAPDYKRVSETYHEIKEVLHPIIASASKIEGVIRTITGGRIDFWTLEDENAGRSRKYHKAIIDEAAFTKANMMAIWERAIQPTLLDYRGSALVLSNTNGAVPDQFFYEICNDPKHGFTEYHAPSAQNPMMSADEIELLRKSRHPLVFAQEYLAEFVDWAGVAFFERGKMLVDGKPIPLPQKVDGVFAIIDTAVKTGKANDGTAVTYYARSKFRGHPLVILDWDIVQIEGALLEAWLPQVFKRLEELATQTQARMGSLGAWIEDQQSGSILLQQARRRGWKAHAIESKLTAMGKDERAINASGYYYQEKIKISEYAFFKTKMYKEAERNHFLTQVLGFRLGDKDAAKRADDLLDTFCYGIAIGLDESKY